MLRKRRRQGNDAPMNLFQKVVSREIDAHCLTRYATHNAPERFQNLSFSGRGDTHDPEANMMKLSFLRRRSKIVEIISAKDLVFALTQTGACAAFKSNDLGQRLCFLNSNPNEVIRSIFFNKLNDSVVTVSVQREDNFRSLKVRSIPIQYITLGKEGKDLDQYGVPLFVEESLCWPGFVEFDDVNGKVLTFSAAEKAYKLWDLATYSFLYSILDHTISEVKISPGILLIIHKRTASHIQIDIVSIESNNLLCSLAHLLHRNKNIDFIEQFNEKLLIKQEGENLQIRDIHTGEIKEIDKSVFVTPSAFIFLYEKQMFLTFRNGIISVWSAIGELINRFIDHELFYPDCNNNSNVHITSHQDLIISYCTSKEYIHGTINISRIFNGKCIASIGSTDCISDANIDSSMEARMALEDTTAIYYNEITNEIFTGNRFGYLHSWSP